MGHLSRIELADFIGHRSPRRVSRRVTLQQNELGLVEDTYVSPDAIPPSGYEPCHQIVVPYHGLFAYHVGSKHWLIDTNGLLLISPGWEFRDEHPVDGLGHGALLITPPREVLHEICRTSAGVELVFRSATRAAGAGLGLLVNVLRNHGAAGDPLQRDELVISVIEQALASPPSKTRPGSAVRRAKELLHSRSGERLTLGEIAAEVGGSPVYLTQEFTRAEGIPLYRYQRRLRLGRALAELPDCDSITGLALDLGFCSHSHFTSAFRSNFGLTPSEYRASNTCQIHAVWRGFTRPSDHQ